ncbi:UNVERIFIED_CONTAM: hypothetical protein FKN15_023123 [Acipenser sinensis]
MPGFYACDTCKASLPVEDKHGRCSSCLRPEHTKEALVNHSFCEFCAHFSKRTLEKHLSRSSTELLHSALPHHPLLERWLRPHSMALCQRIPDDAPGKVAHAGNHLQRLPHLPLLLHLHQGRRRVTVPNDRQMEKLWADILSIAASEEAGEQELAFPSEDAESDSASPAVKLSLIYGITWQQLLLFPGRWTPYIGYNDAEKLGLAQFLPVVASIAALVQTPNLALLFKGATCPNKQCRVSEAKDHARMGIKEVKNRLKQKGSLISDKYLLRIIFGYRCERVFYGNGRNATEGHRIPVNGEEGGKTEGGAQANHSAFWADNPAQACL